VCIALWLSFCLFVRPQLRAQEGEPNETPGCSVGECHHTERNAHLVPLRIKKRLDRQAEQKALLTSTQARHAKGADMDVFQWLIQDHRIAEQRFAEIEKTSEKEEERRELLFAKLREGLEAHEVLEEEYLYPEIDEVSSAKAVVAEALDEHAEFDAILQDSSQ
jgi:hypothetical protein